MNDATRVWLAIILTLLAGATMGAAGYVGRAEDWGLAAPVTALGGALIVAAFAVGRKGPKTTPYVRRIASLMATLLSGWILVLAGYGAAARGWWVALFLVPVAGLVIAVAWVLDAGS